MNLEQIETMKSELAGLNKDAVLLTGLDNAIIGIANREESGLPVALYSRELCVESLMRENDMSWPEAIEFFCYNVSGAYFGEHSPIFAEYVDSTAVSFLKDIIEMADECISEDKSFLALKNIIDKSREFAK